MKIYEKKITEIQTNGYYRCMWGIAEYLEVDPAVFRVVWVLITVFGMGSGIIAYILCWILIPEKQPK